MPICTLIGYTASGLGTSLFSVSSPTGFTGSACAIPCDARAGIPIFLFVDLLPEWASMGGLHRSVRGVEVLLPQRQRLREAVQVTLVDLHLRKGLPAQTKYNAAQRIAYTSCIVMGLGMFVTGLAIYKPTETHWLTSALGGFEMAPWLHFWITMSFLGFFFRPCSSSCARGLEQFALHGEWPRSPAGGGTLAGSGAEELAMSEAQDVPQGEGLPAHPEPAAGTADEQRRKPVARSSDPGGEQQSEARPADPEDADDAMTRRLPGHEAADAAVLAVSRHRTRRAFLGAAVAAAAVTLSTSGWTLARRKTCSL